MVLFDSIFIIKNAQCRKKGLFRYDWRGPTVELMKAVDFKGGFE